jgi:hypothetical protein
MGDVSAGYWRGGLEGGLSPAGRGVGRLEKGAGRGLLLLVGVHIIRMVSGIEASSSSFSS